ncbi:MAG: rhodoquinone biosynthesis methyltransferase RquA [Alphaproteobacteria bacterium]|nr:rhodoquinone biosynthesis methyltransferase RquA [Alphaproteobacteria bacterium]MBO4644247.1 rhodoquinone biosynthesis methyltransferase RquA [Alphaproteobacteria bacterium]
MTQKGKNTIRTIRLDTPPIQRNIYTREGHAIPEYLKTVYNRRYFRPFYSKLFDNEWIARFGSFFMDGRMTKMVTNEIAQGDMVLQLGIASGLFERKIAEKLDSKGEYHIEDISQQKIELIKTRIAPWVNLSVKERDFTRSNDERYDVVIGYFVLHELPDERKRAALKRAVSALKPGGKMVFIDYAQPKRFHPLKYQIKMFNRLFEPFAESLWYNEIKDFAPKTDNLVWNKKTFFGNMYQCVIAQRR